MDIAFINPSRRNSPHGPEKFTGYPKPHSPEERCMPTTCSNNRVIAVANLKGGVGKTTTVLNLAGFAGRLSKRVLMVDTDPQASLTHVALPDDTPAVSLTDAFARR